VSGPDFRDLVGEEVPERERERLRTVHDMLVTAGPPPELSPAIQEPPATGGNVSLLPRRRRSALVVIAAAVAAAAFGGGYFAGGHGHRATAPFRAEHAVQMHGTAAAPNALATIELADADNAGNWPMLVTVQGLPQLPRGGYYELYLTRKGRIAATCGTFTVHSGLTRVYLNAPYNLKRFDGWVVTKHVSGGTESGPRLLTT
jgi:anti-sigma-K factor RskA